VRRIFWYTAMALILSVFAVSESNTRIGIISNIGIGYFQIGKTKVIDTGFSVPDQVFLLLSECQETHDRIKMIRNDLAASISLRIFGSALYAVGGVLTLVLTIARGFLNLMLDPSGASQSISAGAVFGIGFAGTLVAGSSLYVPGQIIHDRASKLLYANINIYNSRF